MRASAVCSLSMPTKDTANQSLFRQWRVWRVWSREYHKCRPGGADLQRGAQKEATWKMEDNKQADCVGLVAK